MSGKKRIYVDEGEWSRLQREAGQLTQVRRDIPRLIESVRAQANRDVENAFLQFDQRQAATDRALAGLSEQARLLEQDTTRRIQDAAGVLRRELSDTANQVRAEVGQRLAEQEQRLAGQIEHERRERERQVADLRSQVSRLEQQSDTAAELASRWLSDARTLHNLIAEYHDHERYRPGALASLSQRLATAEQNQRDGVGAFGLGLAQDLYHDLADLRVEIEQADLSWRTAQAQANHALLLVSGLIDQNEHNDVVDEDGQPIPNTVLDVDRMSRGALSRLRDEVTSARGRVTDPERPMTVDQLRTMVEETAPELATRIGNVVRQAENAQIASQLRANFADMIAQALAVDFQYRVVAGEWHYADDDQLQGIYAKTRHLDGRGEIVIEVSPGPDDRGAAIRLHSYDEGTGTEESRQAVAQSVNASLRDLGIDVGQPQEEAAEADEGPRLIAEHGTDIRTPEARPSSVGEPLGRAR